MPKKRRTKKVRHIRLDDVVFASLKRYAIINDVDMNYALMLLIYNARTKNMNYLVNEKHLVSKHNRNDLVKAKK